jgi:cytochrome c biogenesis protein
MNKANKEKEANLIWRFFSSLRLTIALLILMAAFSVAGTLIPQKEGAIEFIQKLDPSTVRLLDTLGLFDMYHAAWFRSIIAMLALNLIICSLDRFPSAWKRFKAQPSVDRSQPFEDLPSDQVITVKEPYLDAVRKVEGLLASRFKRLRSKQDGSRAFFLADKGRFAHFGVYLVHLSVIVILVGALVGSFWGFEGFVRIPEGDTVDSIMLRNQRGAVSPGFKIRCDRFIVEFYENGSPKEYISDLTFIVEDKEVEKRRILVNHPVTFGGITFYQSTYEQTAGRELRIGIKSPSLPHGPLAMNLEIGKKAELPGKEGTFEVLEVRHMGSVPAALISVNPLQGEPVRFWVFMGFEEIKARLPEQMISSPRFNPSAFKPYTFSLEEIQQRYATGLQANRDPGVPFVWAGFFLITVGFIVTFFTSHRYLRVLAIKEGDITRIKATGSASKNMLSLEKEIKALVEDLKALFKE